MTGKAAKVCALVLAVAACGGDRYAGERTSAGDALAAKAEEALKKGDDARALAAAEFRNPAWGYSHSARDYALARQLARADGVRLDDDVLFAAAWLHDMAAFPKWEAAGVDHADRAGPHPGPVLAQRAGGEHHERRHEEPAGRLAPRQGQRRGADRARDGVRP